MCSMSSSSCLHDAPPWQTVTPNCGPNKPFLLHVAFDYFITETENKWRPEALKIGFIYMLLLNILLHLLPLQVSLERILNILNGNFTYSVLKIKLYLETIGWNKIHREPNYCLWEEAGTRTLWYYKRFMSKCLWRQCICILFIQVLQRPDVDAGCPWTADAGLVTLHVGVSHLFSSM